MKLLLFVLFHCTNAACSSNIFQDRLSDTSEDIISRDVGDVICGQSPEVGERELVNFYPDSDTSVKTIYDTAAKNLIDTNQKKDSGDFEEKFSDYEPERTMIPSEYSSVGNQKSMLGDLHESFIEERRKHYGIIDRDGEISRIVVVGNIEMEGSDKDGQIGSLKSEIEHDDTGSSHGKYWVNKQKTMEVSQKMGQVVKGVMKRSRCEATQVDDGTRKKGTENNQRRDHEFGRKIRRKNKQMDVHKIMLPFKETDRGTEMTDEDAHKNYMNDMNDFDSRESSTKPSIDEVNMREMFHKDKLKSFEKLKSKSSSSKMSPERVRDTEELAEKVFGERMSTLRALGEYLIQDTVTRAGKMGELLEEKTKMDSLRYGDMLMKYGLSRAYEGLNRIRDRVVKLLIPMDENNANKTNVNSTGNEDENSYSKMPLVSNGDRVSSKRRDEGTEMTVNMNGHEKRITDDWTIFAEGITEFKNGLNIVRENSDGSVKKKKEAKIIEDGIAKLDDIVREISTSEYNGNAHLLHRLLKLIEVIVNNEMMNQSSVNRIDESTNTRVLIKRDTLNVGTSLLSLRLIENMARDVGVKLVDDGIATVRNVSDKMLMPLTIFKRSISSVVNDDDLRNEVKLFFLCLDKELQGDWWLTALPSICKNTLSNTENMFDNVKNMVRRNAPMISTDVESLVDEEFSEDIEKAEKIISAALDRGYEKSILMNTTMMEEINEIEILLSEGLNGIKEGDSIMEKSRQHSVTIQIDDQVGVWRMKLGKMSVDLALNKAREVGKKLMDKGMRQIQEGEKLIQESVIKLTQIDSSPKKEFRMASAESIEELEEAQTVIGKLIFDDVEKVREGENLSQDSTSNPAVVTSNTDVTSTGGRIHKDGNFKSGANAGEEQDESNEVKNIIIQLIVEGVERVKAYEKLTDEDNSDFGEKIRSGKKLVNFLVKKAEEIGGLFITDGLEIIGNGIKLMKRILARVGNFGGRNMKDISKNSISNLIRMKKKILKQEIFKLAKTASKEEYNYARVGKLESLPLHGEAIVQGNHGTDKEIEDIKIKEWLETMNDYTENILDEGKSLTEHSKNEEVDSILKTAHEHSSNENGTNVPNDIVTESTEEKQDANKKRKKVNLDIITRGVLLDTSDCIDKRGIASSLKNKARPINRDITKLTNELADDHGRNHLRRAHKERITVKRKRSGRSTDGDELKDGNENDSQPMDSVLTRATEYQEETSKQNNKLLTNGNAQVEQQGEKEEKNETFLSKGYVQVKEQVVKVVQQGGKLLAEGYTQLKEKGGQLLDVGYKQAEMQGSKLLSQAQEVGGKILTDGSTQVKNMGEKLVKQGGKLLNDGYEQVKEKSGKLVEQGEKALYGRLAQAQKQGEKVIEQGGKLLTDRYEKVRERGEKLVEQGDDLLYGGLAKVQKQGEKIIEQGGKLLTDRYERVKERGEKLVEQGDDILYGGLAQAQKLGGNTIVVKQGSKLLTGGYEQVKEQGVKLVEQGENILYGGLADVQTKGENVIKQGSKLLTDRYVRVKEQGEKLVDQGEDLLYEGLAQVQKQGVKVIKQGGKLLTGGYEQVKEQGGKLVEKGGDILYGGLAQAQKQGEKVIKQGGKLLTDGYEQVRERGGKLVEQGEEVLNDGLAQTQKQGEKVIKQGGKLLTDGYEQVKEQGGKLVEQGGKVLNEGLAQAQKQGGEIIKQGSKLLTDGYEQVKEQGGKLVEQGEEVLNGGLAQAQKQGEKVIKLGGKLLTDGYEQVKERGGKLVEQVGKVVEKGEEVLNGGLAQAQKQGEKVIKQGSKLLTDGYEQVKEQGAKVIEQGGKLLTDGYEQVKEQGEKLVEQGGKLVEQGGKVLNEGLAQTQKQGEKVIKQGGKLLTDGYEQVKERGVKVIEQGGKLLTDGYEQVKEQGGKLVEQGGKLVEQGGKVVKQGGKSLSAGLSRARRQSVNSVGNEQVREHEGKALTKAAITVTDSDQILHKNTGSTTETDAGMVTRKVERQAGTAPAQQEVTITLANLTFTEETKTISEPDKSKTKNSETSESVGENIIESNETTVKISYIMKDDESNELEGVDGKNRSVQLTNIHNVSKVNKTNILLDGEQEQTDKQRVKQKEVDVKQVLDENGNEVELNNNMNISVVMKSELGTELVTGTGGAVMLDGSQSVDSESSRTAYTAGKQIGGLRRAEEVVVVGTTGRGKIRADSTEDRTSDASGTEKKEKTSHLSRRVKKAKKDKKAKIEVENEAEIEEIDGDASESIEDARVKKKYVSNPANLIEIFVNVVDGREVKKSYIDGKRIEVTKFDNILESKSVLKAGVDVESGMKSKITKSTSGNVESNSKLRGKSDDGTKKVSDISGNEELREDLKILNAGISRVVTNEETQIQGLVKSQESTYKIKASESSTNRQDLTKGNQATVNVQYDNNKYNNFNNLPSISTSRQNIHIENGLALARSTGGMIRDVAKEGHKLVDASVIRLVETGEKLFEVGLARARNTGGHILTAARKRHKSEPDGTGNRNYDRMKQYRRNYSTDVNTGDDNSIAGSLQENSLVVRSEGDGGDGGGGGAGTQYSGGDISGSIGSNIEFGGSHNFNTGTTMTGGGLVHLAKSASERLIDTAKNVQKYVIGTRNVSTDGGYFSGSLMLGARSRIHKRNVGAQPKEYSVGAETSEPKLISEDNILHDGEDERTEANSGSSMELGMGNNRSHTIHSSHGGPGPVSQLANIVHIVGGQIMKGGARSIDYGLVKAAEIIDNGINNFKSGQNVIMNSAVSLRMNPEKVFHGADIVRENSEKLMREGPKSVLESRNEARMNGRFTLTNAGNRFTEVLKVGHRMIDNGIDVVLGNTEQIAKQAGARISQVVKRYRYADDTARADASGQITVPDGDATGRRMIPDG